MPAAACPGLARAPSGKKSSPTRCLARLAVGGVGEVPGYRGGTSEALKRLERFVRDRLPRYATERNQPTPYVTSELSAHLHFGHISPLTIALEVMTSGADPTSVLKSTWKS